MIANTTNTSPLLPNTMEDLKNKVDISEKEIEVAISNLKILGENYKANEYLTDLTNFSLYRCTYLNWMWGKFDPLVIKKTFKIASYILLNKNNERFAPFVNQVKLLSEAAHIKVKQLTDYYKKNDNTYKKLEKINKKFAPKDFNGMPLETAIQNLKNLSAFQDNEKPLTDPTSLTLIKDERFGQKIKRKAFGGFDKQILKLTLEKAVLVLQNPSCEQEQVLEMKTLFPLAIEGVKKIAETYKNDHNSKMEKAIVKMLSDYRIPENQPSETQNEPSISLAPIAPPLLPFISPLKRSNSKPIQIPLVGNTPPREASKTPEFTPTSCNSYHSTETPFSLEGLKPSIKPTVNFSSSKFKKLPVDESTLQQVLLKPSSSRRSAGPIQPQAPSELEIARLSLGKSKLNSGVGSITTTVTTPSITTNATAAPSSTKKDSAQAFYNRIFKKSTQTDKKGKSKITKEELAKQMEEAEKALKQVNNSLLHSQMLVKAAANVPLVKDELDENWLYGAPIIQDNIPKDPSIPLLQRSISFSGTPSNDATFANSEYFFGRLSGDFSGILAQEMNNRRKSLKGKNSIDQ